MAEGSYQYHGNTAETAHRVQQNVTRLPIMSVGLAFLLGAGVTALLAVFGNHGHSNVNG